MDPKFFYGAMVDLNLPQTIFYEEPFGAARLAGQPVVCSKYSVAGLPINDESAIDLEQSAVCLMEEYAIENDLMPEDFQRPPLPLHPFAFLLSRFCK